MIKNILTTIFKKRGLRTDILFSFLSILFVSTFAIILYSYVLNSQVIINQSRSYSESSSSELKEKVGSALKEAEAIVQALSPLLEGMDLTKGPLDSLFIQSAASLLKANPSIASLYYGKKDGNFLEITLPKFVGGHLKVLGLDLPLSAEAVVQFIKRGDINFQGPGKRRWYFLQDKNVIPFDKEDEGVFDPRVRIWYTKALQSSAPVWSDVYLFTSALAGEAGVSVSKKFGDKNNNFLGVFAADITLGSFSEYLEAHKVTPLSLSYVINEKNQIISSSEKKVLDEKATRLLTIEDLGESPLKKALVQRKKGESHFFVTHENKEYIVYFSSLPVPFDKNLTLVLLTPIDEILGDVIKKRRNVYIVSFFICILGSLFAFFLAKRISHPIITLSQEARRIEHLQLEGKVDIQSNIREIQELRDAMGALKKTMVSIARYIPRTLVKQLLGHKQSIRIGGKQKKVAIFFSDITGFTSFSEDMVPEDLILHLSDYFESMTRLIMKTGGTIDKYIGDGIMAFWGAPLAVQRPIEQVCLSSLLCQEELIHLNERWKKEGKPQFSVRIGIHFGEVIVGNIGSSERMNYTIIGDNVNLGARLESLNKFYGTSILVTDVVYEEMKNLFVFRYVDVVAVKGKKKSTKVYELIASKKGPLSLFFNEDKKMFVTFFEEGIQFYLRREWDKAMEAFDKADSVVPQDVSVSLYKERCVAFKKNPPPDEWDGTTIYTQK